MPRRLPSSPPAENADVQPLPSLTQRTVIHELQVHQVELAQQNDELPRAHRELVVARDRFINLFDFAPVAYLTLDRGGRIVEANLTAATEFGADRQAMLGRPFVQFVAPCDHGRWQRVAVRTLARNDLRHVLLTLVRHDGRQFQAELDCRRCVDATSHAQLRLTLTEISQRRLAAKNRRIAASGSAARESERRALALRLHEGLGQRLAGIKLGLGALGHSADVAGDRALVEMIAAEIDASLALVRRLSSDLHPLMLNDLGLSAALDWLVRDAASRLDLSARLHVAVDDSALDGSLAISIYRLTEMALAHFTLYVVAGISVELLHRPNDWVLLFQSVPGHPRRSAPSRPITALPQALKDLVFLLGGRVELSELPGDIRRVCVFLGARPNGKSHRAPDGPARPA